MAAGRDGVSAVSLLLLRQRGGLDVQYDGSGRKQVSPSRETANNSYRSQRLVGFDL